MNLTEFKKAVEQNYRDNEERLAAAEASAEENYRGGKNDAYLEVLGLLDDCEAFEGTQVLVVGDRCWGRGDTLEEALGNARAEGGRKGVRSYAAFVVSKTAQVDPVSGGIVYDPHYRPRRIAGRPDPDR